MTLIEPTYCTHINGAWMLIFCLGLVEGPPRLIEAGENCLKAVCLIYVTLNVDARLPLT
jgi:hypothetical protein